MKETEKIRNAAEYLLKKEKPEGLRRTALCDMCENSKLRYSKEFGFEKFHETVIGYTAGEDPDYAKALTKALADVMRIVKLKRCHTAEEMTAMFVRDGWSADTTFVEADESSVHGCTSLIDSIRRGKKYFVQGVTGNVYDECGKIALYNI